MSRDLKLFAVAVGLGACGCGIFDSIFNNYLTASFDISSFQRSMLEIPRELPGMLVALASAFLFFLPSRRLAACTMLLSFAGLLALGTLSNSYATMLPWLFVFSLGQHLFMPLNTGIGMELARKGQDGRRLGQLNSVRNAFAVLGSFVVFLGFRYLHLNFAISFVLASLCLLTAACFLLRMEPGAKVPPRLSLTFHRQYRLYYWLCVLFGTRKQIFLTFAPWVLVTVFKQPTQTLAWLLTIGGVTGIVTQPLIGRAIDHLGERAVLCSEAGILVFVCLGYGFAGSLFSHDTAFLVAATCFVLDQLLISTGIARSTYLKKIVVDPAHVSPTLSLAVSIDHVFSIGVALLGGLIWNVFGYQVVFFCGALIAIVNLFSARRIKFVEA